MKIKLKQGNRASYQYCEWICDTAEEVAQLPKSPMGSTVYVIHTGETYIIDSLGTWYPKSGNGEVIPCDCVEELTIWGDIPVNE